MSNGIEGVGHTDDVEGISYRSAPELEPSLVTQIEDCGIPLDCSSAGDSFQPQDPCENLDLSFYNVMGQEDKFRQENGQRVDRGGVARIVFTTGEDVTIEKIDYASNPQNEDNPTFTDQWDPNVLASDKHEVFVNVNPDSLYAFKINIKVEGCPDTDTSGIYYFSTGDKIDLGYFGGNFSMTSDFSTVSTTSLSREISTSNYIGEVTDSNISNLSVGSGLTTSVNTNNLVDFDLSIGPIEELSDNFTTLVSSQTV